MDACWTTGVSEAFSTERNGGGTSTIPTFGNLMTGTWKATMHDVGDVGSDSHTRRLARCVSRKAANSRTLNRDRP